MLNRREILKSSMLLPFALLVPRACQGLGVFEKTEPTIFIVLTGLNDRFEIKMSVKEFSNLNEIKFGPFHNYNPCKFSSCNVYTEGEEIYKYPFESTIEVRNRDTLTVCFPKPIRGLIEKACRFN